MIQKIQQTKNELKTKCKQLKTKKMLKIDFDKIKNEKTAKRKTINLKKRKRKKRKKNSIQNLKKKDFTIENTLNNNKQNNQQQNIKQQNNNKNKILKQKQKQKQNKDKKQKNVYFLENTESIINNNDIKSSNEYLSKEKKKNNYFPIPNSNVNNGINVYKKITEDIKNINYIKKLICDSMIPNLKKDVKNDVTIKRNLLEIRRKLQIILTNERKYLTYCIYLMDKMDKIKKGYENFVSKNLEKYSDIQNCLYKNQKPRLRMQNRLYQ